MMQQGNSLRKVLSQTSRRSNGQPDPGRFIDDFSGPAAVHGDYRQSVSHRFVDDVAGRFAKTGKHKKVGCSVQLLYSASGYLPLESDPISNAKRSSFSPALLDFGTGASRYQLELGQVPQQSESANRVP